MKSKKNTDNKLLSIQEMLMREMERLDDDEHMKKFAGDECRRSNALSNTAQSFIKTINISLRVLMKD